MSHSPIDPEVTIRPETPPAASAYLWAGLVSLLSAAVIGTGSVFHATQSGGSPKLGLFVAVGLIFLGGVLLYAQSRAAYWQSVTKNDLLEEIAEDPRTRRNNYLMMAFLVLVALVPRLLVLHHSLWYDELWTLNFMRSGPIHALRTQQGYNNHLLNSFLCSLLLEVRRALGDPAAAKAIPPPWLVRLPAFCAGVAAVPMLYATVRQVQEKPIAFAAALLLALSPAAIDFSGQTRGYSLLVFFTIAQAYFLIRGLETGAPTDWVGWLLCAWLGTFAHLYFVFVIAVNALFLAGRVLWLWRTPAGRKQAAVLFEQGVVLLVAWATLTVLTYCGVLYGLQKIAKLTAGTEPVAQAHEVILPMLQMWGGLPQGVWRGLYFGLILLLPLFGLLALARQRSSAGIYLLLLLLLPPLLVEATKPHYVYMRFFLFELPAFLTLLAVGMGELAGWISGARTTQKAGQGVVFPLLVLGFLLLVGRGLGAILFLPKQDYQGVAERIQAEQTKGATVVVMGAGGEWFGLYGVHPKAIDTETKLRALLAAAPEILLVDLDLTVNPRSTPPRLPHLVREWAGAPIAVFPARFEGWSHRWLDGDSDIKIYRLRASQVGPEAKIE